MTDTTNMDRNLALEAVRVTEAAALSASRLMGRGDEKAAHQAAVAAMRLSLNPLAVEGTRWVRVREGGARIMLIGDGDVSGVIATSRPGSGVDLYVGSGGAPEGVLAAAALRCIGGQMQGRLVFRNDDERGRATRIGITDFNRKYGLLDLAKGDVMFAATGVTGGTMLQGVRRFAGGAVTHSMVMRSKSGTVRIIEAQHNFTRKTNFGALAGCGELQSA